jgi:hypothetical protein
MINKISLCGFDCGICPAFKTNLKTTEDRESVDEGWKKFHRTSGWIYTNSYCNGCFNDPDLLPLWEKCHIRRCVISNGIEICGYCPDYPCPRIENMIHITKTIAKRTVKDGTEEEYKKFALPHLNEERLNDIHKKWSENKDETDFKPKKLLTKKFPFNSDLESSEKLHYLHSTLESIMTLHCKTIGGQQQEKKKNKEVAKFLWIVGRYGTLITENNDIYLEITAEEMKNKLKYGKYRINQKLLALKSHQIKGELLEGKIRLEFTREPEIATILKKYIDKLLETNTERSAYSKFWKADIINFKV